MPATIPSAFTTHLAGEATTIATLWSITRTDGEAYYFTDHDQALTYEGNTYVTGVGYDRSALEDKADISPDNLDIRGIIDTDHISAADIRAGLFDGAEIYIYVVNWEDTTQALIRRRGWLGEVRQNNLGQFDAELRGLAEALTEKLEGIYTPGCRTDLGSSLCGRLMEPAEWAESTYYLLGEEISVPEYPDLVFQCTVAGDSSAASEFDHYWFDVSVGDTVTLDNHVTWVAGDSWVKTSTVLASPAPDRRTFSGLVDQARFDTDATFYDGGLIRFDTGANAGLSREIKTASENSAGELEFSTFLRFPFTVAAGDSFTVWPGCTKTFTTCKARFGNGRRFRGFPFVPGDDYLTNYPEPKY